MDFLQEAQAIYETMTAKAENVWVTVYPDPGGKNNCLFAGEGDPSDQWHLMESIMRNAANRYNRFKIRVALGNKNAMPQEIPVSVTRSEQRQVAGIGNIPYQPADIGAIKREMKEEFAEQMKREKELWEMQNQIAGLSYELQQKKKKSGDVMDKIEGFAQTTGLDLSNPQAIQAVSGLLMGALDKILGVFTRHPLPTPGLAGGRPRPGTTNVHHLPADSNTETETEQPDTDEGQPLTEEDYRALDALDILKEAGADDASELLLKVANYYKNNPEQARGFLKFL